MNYRSSSDFDVAGSQEPSVAVATYEDGSFVLVATESTEYMKERSVEIPLRSEIQIDALARNLQNIAANLRAQKR